VAYTGACKDESIKREKAGCATAGQPNYDPSIPMAFHDPRACGGPTGVTEVLRDAPWLRIESGILSVAAAGAHQAEAVDVRGKVAARWTGSGPMSHDLAALPGPGLYQVRVRTASGTAARTFSWMGP
jgi:hypothetical protein